MENRKTWLVPILIQMDVTKTLEVYATKGGDQSEDLDGSL
jgi:hypothetical protein